MTELPKSDHELGYTSTLVNMILEKEHLCQESFWHWMDGQTMAIDKGVTIVYEDDLMRFLEYGSRARIYD